MQRWLSARRTITGNPERLREALLDAAPELLQTATGTPAEAPQGDGAITLRLYGRKGGAKAHKNVRAHIGEARVRPNWVSLPIRWEAELGRVLFPSFEGTIEMEELSASRVDLAIVGHHRPPLGPIGDVLDLTVMADVAEATVRSLVEQLARALVDRLYGDSPPEVRRGPAMTVADVMTRDAITVDEGTTLRDAAALMLRNSVSGVPVVDEDDHVVGVISQRDLLDRAASAPTGFGRAYAEAARHRDATTVGEACTRPARTTEADTQLRDAAREMAVQDVDRLVVLDGARRVGIVTRSDVLRALVRDDDVIAAAINDMLTGSGDDDVHVRVEAGQVTLDGEVELRSRVREIQQWAGTIDGVMSVDADLVWRVDDVIPVMPPML